VVLFTFLTIFGSMTLIAMVGANGSRYP
jgi:hypothetical protein